MQNIDNRVKAKTFTYDTDMIHMTDTVHLG